MTEIPGRGSSSPIIVGDRIFLTTAVPTGKQAGPAPQGQMAKIGGGYGVSEHSFELLCLDRKTGKLIWRRTAKTATPHEGYHQTYGSFASNSPATDGKRIYAFFGSRGVYCYDLEGKLIWEKDFGVQMRMRMAFGEGMAAVVYGNRLILVFDHDAGDSFMAVLDTGKRQILVSATNKVRSYDFESGKVIWECAGLGANVIPAPVRQDDLVFLMSGFMNPNLMAIRLGREGDLTGTDAIVWSQTRGNSYTPSPVLHDNKLYVLTDNGMISCYNAKTGEPYYHQVRLPKSYSFKSSLVGANGKLYLSSENEDVIVLAMGEKYEVLATNTLTDQMFVATPAIADGKIYLRSQTRLYCIGEN
jgi:outer membrane protein assembly factor BamB